MSKNTQRLSNTLSKRMKKTANGAVPTTIELGIVNGNLSITTDSLHAEIPRGDYMVNLMLTGARRTDEASCGDGIHSHALPEGFREIQPGDRIIVAWCGTEPVVIAIVTSS